MDTKMYIIFDTETTNLPIKGANASNPLFPRVCQFACLLLDASFNEVSAFKTPIKLPKHTVITPGAFAAHKLTKEYCDKYGMELEKALLVFQEFLEKSEVQVAHNIIFDKARLEDEFSLAFADNTLVMLNTFCTMHSTTELCKLPSKFPGTKYKWPKLHEAFTHIFHETFSNAHDAMADVRATARIFKWLKQCNKPA